MEINERLINEIAKTLNIRVSQVTTVLTLLETQTVPFIARYRKEQTGALDEEQIREISKTFEYQMALEKRKDDCIRLIDEKGMLTDELKAKILACEKLIEVEDLYRPYKEKKKTKATEAIANGLEPLAKAIMEFPKTGSLEDMASAFVTEKVKTTQDALQGAAYIIAENVSDDANFRTFIRTELKKNGVLITKIKKNAVDENNTYQMYYDYNEAIKSLKPHRILAFSRAENEGVISVDVDYDNPKVQNYLEGKVIKDKNSISYDLVSNAIKDSLKRLIIPSVEREIRAELFEQAEDASISIFSMNLKNLLLQQPLKGKVVLGVDPAYRTGCKLAVLDKTGKVLDKGVMYPHQKNVNEVVDVKRIEDAKNIVRNFVKKYAVEVIAIGNGTASRETEEFIADLIKEFTNVYYAIVSEAGASVYSASDLAREEFPDYHVEERSAVSIGRRLQDPLAELVKIEPKAIGVGQYQHDITQAKLSDSLDFVVTEAVNRVGVNVNTASKSLLSYVAGLNKKVAENIVKFREENGAFRNRDEIKKVPKLGDKTYEQAIGFLRIPEGDNPLDLTPIHPESYKAAKEIIKELKIDITKLGSEETKKLVLTANKADLLAKTGIDKYTLDDILDAFVSPSRDPRDELDKPLLRAGVTKIEDLKAGMELQGVVRNVVDFGVFVDCGMKNDGLIHISKLSRNYIKHPSDVLNVGDIIKCYVLDVDLKRNKVALTLLKD